MATSPPTMTLQTTNRNSRPITLILGPLVSSKMAFNFIRNQRQWKLRRRSWSSSPNSSINKINLTPESPLSTNYSTNQMMLDYSLTKLTPKKWTFCCLLWHLRRKVRRIIGKSNCQMIYWSCCSIIVYQINFKSKVYRTRLSSKSRKRHLLRDLRVSEGISPFLLSRVLVSC